MVGIAHHTNYRSAIAPIATQISLSDQWIDWHNLCTILGNPTEATHGLDYSAEISTG
jgi:hypothetical protein